MLPRAGAPGQKRCVSAWRGARDLTGAAKIRDNSLIVSAIGRAVLRAVTNWDEDFRCEYFERAIARNRRSFAS